MHICVNACPRMHCRIINVLKLSIVTVVEEQHAHQAFN